jgi:oligopeptide/dipeptide ABC transporter ATP-binding protein
MAILIEANGLTKLYFSSRTPLQVLTGKHPALRAVDAVDLRLDRGESVGLVGESGSGKTTIGRLLLKLTEPTAGDIIFDGMKLADLRLTRLRQFRQQAQLVFQNPFDAVNPRFTIRRAIAEPLINTGIPRAEHAERIADSLRLVHLGDVARYLEKHPAELSGGQLQRVVLARALVVRPRFLVADEPVSMLDVSVRAGILNLMRELRDRLGLTALYISHDLTLVRYVCQRTLVMYLGKIVEDGPTNEIITRPAHPYTQALIKAVPRPQTSQSHDPLPISGGLANPSSPPSGCRLRDRCPYTFDRCATEEPALIEIAPGHRAACHLHQIDGVAASSNASRGVNTRLS